MRAGKKERVKFYIEPSNEKMLGVIKTIYDLSYSDTVNYVLNQFNLQLLEGKVDITELHIKKKG